MKPTADQTRKRKAFTIVELLTVMSIIVILIGLMVPALNKVRRFATDVKQKAQFNSMNAAIELFNNEFEGYPPSTAMDVMTQPYCPMVVCTPPCSGGPPSGASCQRMSRWLHSGIEADGGIHTATA